MRGPVFGLIFVLAVATRASAAAPVVVANQTNRDLVVTVSAATDRPLRVTIDRADFTVLTVTGFANVSFLSNNRLQTVRVDEGCVYAFAVRGEEIRLEPLLESGGPPGGAKATEQGVIAPPEVGVVTIKVLVDRQEPAVRAGRNGWEARMRKRIAAASEILERQCRVRLEVVAVDTWESAAEARSIGDIAGEFERTVAPRPADLVIGFASRVTVAEPGGRMAATPVIPLGHHILIDESLPLAEPQRLEVLVHELGHFLGAVHTKDSESVMRMSPGDGRSLQKDFRIGFDPLNALAINLVARQALKAPAVHSLGALDAKTRQQLANLYKEMARLTPEDQSVDRNLRLLEDVVRARTKPSTDPLVSGARAVVAAVSSAAGAATELGLSGDRLTEHCIRAAAAAALKQPEGQRVPAFLLGIAVGLDSSDLLRKAPSTRRIWGLVESDDERNERLKVIGQPTVLGQHGLARHFLIAAALTSVAGAKAADPGGIVHDLFDTETGGSFRFTELALELAGAQLARTLAAEPQRLIAFAGSFAFSECVPALDGFEERLDRDEFNRRYGNFSDDRFRQKEAELRRRIAELPANKAK